MNFNLTPSDINQTFIIEPLLLTGGTPTISACTAVFTNGIISCSGDTQISLETGVVLFNGSIYTNQNISGDSITANNYFSGNTNLSEIINNAVLNGGILTGGTFNNITGVLTLGEQGKPNILITGFTDYYTTGATMVNNTIYFNRNDSLSAYSVSLSSLDIRVTGFTYNDDANTLTISDSLDNSFSATINSVSGLTVNGTLSFSGSGNSIINFNNPLQIGHGDLFGPTTYSAGYFDNLQLFFEYKDSLTNTGSIINLAGSNGSGGDGFTPDATFSEIVSFDFDTGLYGGLQIYPNSITTKSDNISNTFTGIVYDRDYSNNYLPLSLITYSDLTGKTDIHTTGFTYLNNQFVISDNTGGLLSATINNMTGLTVNGLLNVTTLNATGGTINALNAVNFSVSSALTPSYMTSNRLIYTDSGHTLTTGNAIFDGVNMVLPAAGALTVGTGGLIVGSGGAYGTPGFGDVIINGNLTVYGNAISAFTSHLYVEDSFVLLNYNPTGSSTNTSVGSGFEIQDGSGLSGYSINFDVRAMNGFTGITSNNIPNIIEYSGTTGYSNRAFITQVNDIVIRSTDVTTPNGVRLLAEFDVLDGGQY